MTSAIIVICDLQGFIFSEVFVEARNHYTDD